MIEQLCEIEQSLGVCHIAQLQPWPSDTRSSSKESTSKPDVVVQQPPLLPPSTREPPSFAQRRPLVHQPQPPKTSEQKQQFPTTLGLNGRQGQSLQLPVDPPLAVLNLRSRTAQGQPVDKHADEGRGIVARGSVPHGRLPAQLADLRHYARKFASHCDGLQAIVPPADMLTQVREDAVFSSLEAAHMATMERARHLLAPMQS